jgi:prepilin-type N-terminal cleavage/methylation domain-containing protein
MMTQQQLSSRSGLTLIEIVMATAVLAVVLLGMFSAMNNSQRADMLTRERAAAAEACHAMLDTMLTGALPAPTDPATVVLFPVYYQTGNGEVDTTNNVDDDGDGIVDDSGEVVLKPAATYPSDPWTFSGTTQPGASAMTVLVGTVATPAAGVAVVKAGVDVGNTKDENNDDLIEVRVVVAWRSALVQANGTPIDQRIEATSRRIR